MNLPITIPQDSFFCFSTFFLLLILIFFLSFSSLSIDLTYPYSLYFSLFFFFFFHTILSFPLTQVFTHFPTLLFSYMNLPTIIPQDSFFCFPPFFFLLILIFFLSFSLLSIHLTYPYSIFLSFFLFFFSLFSHSPLFPTHSVFLPISLLFCFCT